MDRLQVFPCSDGVAKQLLNRALIALLLLLPPGQLAAVPANEHVCGLDKTGYLLTDRGGKVLDACRADTPLVPASTLKILTAWLAIKHWGADFRFSTDFYLDEDQLLWVRGLGDPMLVSEELALVAQALKAAGLSEVNGIGIDTSYYANHIDIPGRSRTDNPYDAPVAALAVNFNTVNLRRKHGKLQSAEAQTPLTQTARKLGRRVDGKAQRINLRHAADSGTYFAEILRRKLTDAGITVDSPIRRGSVPETAKLIYRHENSRQLPDVLKAMLQYSTNFIANQLFLNLGAEAYGAPATMEKAVRHAQREIAETFGWNDFRIVEGSGLSRDNRLSARQLTELLQAFRPWKELLPKHDGVHAKTGTLNGIRTLAGYLSPGGRPFAILINRPAPRNLRYDLVKQWKIQRPK